MIDRRRLDSITGGDKETERMLLGLFLDTARSVLTRLQKGEDWAKTVHELKGAAANLGINELAEICKAAEHNEPKGPAREAFFGQIQQSITEIERLIA